MGERRVEHYYDAEISKNIISKMKGIIVKRASGNCIDDALILDQYFERLLKGNGVQGMHTVVGNDWFLIYYLNNRDLQIAFWVADNNRTEKVIQTLEMLKVFKTILVRNDCQRVFTQARHNTSYKFYRSFLTRGYITEVSDSMVLSKEMPLELARNFSDNYAGLESMFFDAFKNDIVIERLYGNYVFHDLVFKVNENFTKKYQKQRAKL